MGLRVYKPYTPSRRGRISLDFAVLTPGVHPEKSLLRPNKKRAGRNSSGQITVRHQGGGNKRHYRIVDFKREKDGVSATVESIQYDPNRSSFIALTRYDDGQKRYIIAPDGVSVGDRILSGAGVDIKDGNSMPLDSVPVGTIVHNIEFLPGGRAKLCRAAGSYAQLLAKEGNEAQIRLPSGEVRKVSLRCRATIGRVGNSDHSNIKLGNAGAKRHRGIRPTVRGTVMNPRDHPHGGGEGKSNSGRPPCSPTGVKAKGFRTRKKSKSKRHIVKARG